MSNGIFDVFFYAGCIAVGICATSCAWVLGVLIRDARHERKQVKRMIDSGENRRLYEAAQDALDVDWTAPDGTRLVILNGNSFVSFPDIAYFDRWFALEADGK